MSVDEITNIQDEEPLVTIGIPTYNRPKLIFNTIKSARNQTYKNLEIIISDNCSPDKSYIPAVKEIMKVDKRVSFIRQPKNLGSHGNFGFLLEEAKGKYFMWLADDDYISNDYIEEIIKEFKKYPEFSLIGGQGYFYLGDQFEKLEVINLLSDSPTERVRSYIGTVTYNSIFYGVFRPRQVNFDFKKFFGWDWLQPARLAYIGKVKTLNHVSVYRNKIGESSQKFTNKEYRQNFFNIIKNLNKDIKRNKLFSDLSKKESIELRKFIEFYITKYFVPPEIEEKYTWLMFYMTVYSHSRRIITKLIGKQNYIRFQRFYYKLRFMNHDG
jgi:glycosyltransferase involved in cell wall biosynthesis